jgi:hypothetical protein
MAQVAFSAPPTPKCVRQGTANSPVSSRLGRGWVSPAVLTGVKVAGFLDGCPLAVGACEKALLQCLSLFVGFPQVRPSATRCAAQGLRATPPGEGKPPRQGGQFCTPIGGHFCAPFDNHLVFDPTDGGPMPFRSGQKPISTACLPTWFGKPRFLARRRGSIARKRPLELGHRCDLALSRLQAASLGFPVLNEALVEAQKPPCLKASNYPRRER